ncbi:hypothetical protein SLEP1_g22482 [Rubroshorea leprosula]|uniref:Uncharacterized protein n=1 Tax=Rubroshorea leprosula TaxID=152421 RepID=A0AAV5JEP7_9ROSI|nr:hypothetical protein SLEP1_g22482 [Rubroshorea leprosula]
MYYSIHNVPYDQEPSKLPPPAAYAQPPAYGVPASAPTCNTTGPDTTHNMNRQHRLHLFFSLELKAPGPLASVTASPTFQTVA